MKTCPQCSSHFEIREKDKEYYQKLDVPEPTMCPDCRKQRRISWRNERALYKAKCDLCKKDVISMFSEDKPYTQYCNDCYYGDKWDGTTYGREYDFNRPFFEQFAELQTVAPRLINANMRNENSDYANLTADLKNCYLVFAGENSEDCYYSKLCQNNRNCVDSDFIWDSELCYDCLNVTKCYHCISGIKLDNCSDCYFSFELRGCKNCLFCHNLRGKEYHIFNEPHSKEEFEAKVNELKLGTLSGYQNTKESFGKLLREKAIHRTTNILNCEDCEGDNLNI